MQLKQISSDTYHLTFPIGESEHSGLAGYMIYVKRFNQWHVYVFDDNSRERIVAFSENRMQAIQQLFYYGSENRKEMENLALKDDLQLIQDLRKQLEKAKAEIGEDVHAFVYLDDRGNLKGEIIDSRTNKPIKLNKC
jgi:predicted ATP-dependent endonuclease of OLD family